MFKKMYKHVAVIALAVASLSPLTAQEKPGVELALDIASTYIWRGGDAYAEKEDFAGEKRDVFNFAPSLMPSLTVNTGVEGLWFNLWGAYSLTARDGADGGLKSKDELDITVGYDFETTIGSWSIAYIVYAYPSDAFGATYTEIAASYTVPVILSPTIGLAAADANGGSTQYLTFGISHAFELSETMALEPSLTFGWWYYPNATSDNWGHLDFSLPFSIAASDSVSFHVTPGLVYRVFSDANKNYPNAKTGKTYAEPAAIALVTIGAAFSF